MCLSPFLCACHILLLPVTFFMCLTPQFSCDPLCIPYYRLCVPATLSVCLSPPCACHLFYVFVTSMCLWLSFCPLCPLNVPLTFTCAYNLHYVPVTFCICLSPSTSACHCLCLSTLCACDFFLCALSSAVGYFPTCTYLSYQLCIWSWYAVVYWCMAELLISEEKKLQIISH